MLAGFTKIIQSHLTKNTLALERADLPNILPPLITSSSIKKTT